MFSTARREGLATNCVSYCSCVVRAARVVLMLFSEMCCLSIDRDQRELITKQM